MPLTGRLNLRVSVKLKSIFGKGTRYMEPCIPAPTVGTESKSLQRREVNSNWRYGSRKELYQVGHAPQILMSD